MLNSRQPATKGDLHEPLILEIEYFSRNYKKKEWANLKKLFVVDLICDSGKDKIPGFVPRILSVKGITSCKYESYGDIIIHKSADVSWDKLRPQINEIIRKSLKKTGKLKVK